MRVNAQKSEYVYLMMANCDDEANMRPNKHRCTIKVCVCVCVWASSCLVLLIKAIKTIKTNNKKRT